MATALKQILLTPGGWSPAGGSPAELLLNTGSFGDEPILVPKELAMIGEASRSLLFDLEENFILFALVSPEHAGVRRVLKTSHFFHIELRGPAILASLGARPAALAIPVPAAGDAASYHLEVHLPSGVVSESLELPSGSSNPTGAQDEFGGVVAHAHGAFEVRSESERSAYAYLVASGGLGGVALLFSPFLQLWSRCFSESANMP
ncbi:hypothetical protein EXU48_01910 [Occultella glacieicola]|uniref:Uncharacterized protein n=1 Tax=Occultella glacieicola TaxID=2518684 RepID=A0ABY2ECS2_9MICO|nr:hypothetical protein [Occultella glacieicola]TDE98967.1 hypothetical protein EXU48_01910 [Occultella glacieicola]